MSVANSGRLDKTARTTPIGDAPSIHPALTAQQLRIAIRDGRLPATVVRGRYSVNPDEVVECLIAEINA